MELEKIAEQSTETKPINNISYSKLSVVWDLTKYLVPMAIGGYVGNKVGEIATGLIIGGIVGSLWQDSDMEARGISEGYDGTDPSEHI